MSNCSEHKKDLFGQPDMKVVAEAIGDLHYETLSQLFYEIGNKLRFDAQNDYNNGREKLANSLFFASDHIGNAFANIHDAWQTSKKFMEEVKK